MRGVLLRLTHPEVPTCDECCEWVFDPKTWQRLGYTERDRRGKGDPTPCWQCPKIPKGEEPSPATGRKSELTQDNEQAYYHYLCCKAVGRFPEDGVVERRAGLIRMVEDQVGRNAAVEPIMAVLSGLVSLAKR